MLKRAWEGIMKSGGGGEEQSGPCKTWVLRFLNAIPELALSWLYNKYYTRDGFIMVI